MLNETECFRISNAYIGPANQSPLTKYLNATTNLIVGGIAV
jgi:hypothetical protein